MSDDQKVLIIYYVPRKKSLFNYFKNGRKYENVMKMNK